MGTEAVIVNGPERRNAQASFNDKGGKIPAHRLQNPMNPFGVGFSLNFTRNFVSVFGMRMACGPITKLYEKLAGGKSQKTTIAGDFTANILSACISMPVHQTWNFVVAHHEIWDKPVSEKVQAIKGFLKKQYLKPEGGISPIIFRDAGLRCAYISAILTAFVNIERTFVAYWPQ